MPVADQGTDIVVLKRRSSSGKNIHRRANREKGQERTEQTAEGRRVRRRSSRRTGQDRSEQNAEAVDRHAQHVPQREEREVAADAALVESSAQQVSLWKRVLHPEITAAVVMDEEQPERKPRNSLAEDTNRTDARMAAQASAVDNWQRGQDALRETELALAMGFYLKAVECVKQARNELQSFNRTEVFVTLENLEERIAAAIDTSIARRERTDERLLHAHKRDSSSEEEQSNLQSRDVERDDSEHRNRGKDRNEEDESEHTKSRSKQGRQGQGHTINRPQSLSQKPSSGHLGAAKRGGGHQAGKRRSYTEQWASRRGDEDDRKRSAREEDEGGRLASLQFAQRQGRLQLAHVDRPVGGARDLAH
eukprot:1882861-Rhodomonas_salina.1